MNRRILLGILIATIAITVLFVQPQRTHAYATVSSYTLTCSSFTASGTTNAPFVDLYVSTPTGTHRQLFAASGTFNATLNFPVQPTGTMIWFAVFGANSSGFWDGQAFFYFGKNCAPAAAPAGPAVKWFEPNDDRVNREAGAPAVMYCRNKGDIHIYKVEADTSWGKIALVVTKAQVEAVVNSNPTDNTLIKQSADGSVKVFYLPATKEFSLISKDSRPPYKPYSFVWKGCA